MHNERKENWGRTPLMENPWQAMYKAIMWQLDACHGRHLQGHGARSSVEDEERFLTSSQINLIYACSSCPARCGGDKAKRSCWLPYSGAAAHLFV